MTAQSALSENISVPINTVQDTGRKNNTQPSHLIINLFYKADIPFPTHTHARAHPRFLRTVQTSFGEDSEIGFYCKDTEDIYNNDIFWCTHT